MLTKVQIEKFRSCHSVSLEGIHEVLALVGRNGAGKTNILKAIEWASKFCSHGIQEPEPPRRRSLTSEDGDVTLYFTLANESICYHLSKSTSLHMLEPKHEVEERLQVTERLYVCNGEAKTLVVERKNENVKLINPETGKSSQIEISGNTSTLLFVYSLYPDEDYFRRLALLVLSFTSSIKYYPLHNFDEPYDDLFIIGSVYRKWKTESIKDGDSIRSVLFKILDLYIENRDKFDELNSLIGHDGLGVVGDIAVNKNTFNFDGNVNSTDESNNFYRITFSHPSDAKYRFSMSDLSFGTKRILFLLVSMLYDHASVALLEQPEDGVHTGIVNKLAPLFRSYAMSSQFIIASHSTTLLDKCEPDELYFVANRTGITTARPLSSIEKKAAEKFLREEGPLSEFVDMIEGT